MITAKISRQDTGYILSITGHAGSADYGKDLVCAAASALTYATAQALDDAHRNGKINAEPFISLDAGDSVIALNGDLGEFAEAVFYVAAAGFKALAATYPQFVMFSEDARLT